MSLPIQKFNGNEWIVCGLIWLRVVLNSLIDAFFIPFLTFCK